MGGRGRDVDESRLGARVWVAVRMISEQTALRIANRSRTLASRGAPGIEACCSVCERAQMTSRLHIDQGYGAACVLASINEGSEFITGVIALVRELLQSG